MKKNLLFAGIIYAIATMALLVYLSVSISSTLGVEEEEQVGIAILYVAGGTFLCFLLSFLAYLIYFLIQTKVLEDSAYVGYLKMSVRIILGLLVSSILGALLTLFLVYCQTEGDATDSVAFIEYWWDIVIPVVAFVTVNMVCFITLKPRP